MMASDVKMQIQKIQAKIDGLKRKRDIKLAKADAQFEKTRREATDRHNKSYRQVMKEYDPKIVALEERRRKADREARQVWDDAQKSKRPK